MGREGARRGVLVLLLVMGCTTTKINLAIHEGGTKEGGAAGEDGSGDGNADANADADADADGATDFDQAYDAGPETGSSPYVEFTCCAVTDGSTCSDGRLDGLDVCSGDGKDPAGLQCTALGLMLKAYRVVGCSSTDAS